MKTGSIPISAAGHGANGATNGATRFEAALMGQHGSLWVKQAETGG